MNYSFQALLEVSVLPSMAPPADSWRTTTPVLPESPLPGPRRDGAPAAAALGVARAEWGGDALL